MRLTLNKVVRLLVSIGYVFAISSFSVIFMLD